MCKRCSRSCAAQACRKLSSMSEPTSHKNSGASSRLKSVWSARGSHQLCRVVKGPEEMLTRLMRCLMERRKPACWIRVFSPGTFCCSSRATGISSILFTQPASALKGRLEHPNTVVNALFKMVFQFRLVDCNLSRPDHGGRDGQSFSQRFSRHR